MFKIITIVGTSLFYNHLKLKDDSNLARLENAGAASNWDNDVILTKKRLEFAKLVAKEWSNSLETSSEIKSILAIASANRTRNQEKPIEVHLLATDTIVSRLAAELLVKWFQEFKKDDNIEIKFNPSQDVIEDLQVNELGRFKKGLTRLIERFYQIAQNDLWAWSPSNLCINITGGYKAIIPYLTILGQVNQVNVCYIFEETNTLLNIPSIPIQLNESLFDKFWTTFQKLETDTFLKASDYYEFTHEAESCIELDEQGNFGFNSLGLALWERYKANFFIFFIEPDIWSTMQKQTKVIDFFRQSFIIADLRNSSIVAEGTHKTVSKKFHDTPRIYFFEDDGQIYVYQSFENHDAHERYIGAVQFDEALKLKVMKYSSIQKIRLNHV